MNPTPLQLWKQADGDAVKYRKLMREHGLILKREPGDDSPVLPCGYGEK